MTSRDMHSLRELALRVLHLTGAPTADQDLPAAGLSGQRFDQQHAAEDRLIAGAQMELARRRARGQFLPEFADSGPAWTILLDLLDNEVQGREVSVTSACLGSGAPSSTALRYVAMLHAEELVWRIADPKDARKVQLKLSNKGRDELMKALAHQQAAVDRVLSRAGRTSTMAR